MTASPPGGPTQSASAQFLREAEIRRGAELLYFGHAYLLRALDPVLDREGLGRAHQRVLYFVARQPGLTVGELLRLLGITKQSLGRVLGELTSRGLVESRTGDRDQRQRLLRLTAQGTALEAELFNAGRARLSAAYLAAGQTAVTGFWTVLENMIPASERPRIEALGRQRS